MLKTALALACLGVVSTAAFAFETPKYDRKIERAAIMQVSKKMGALRETVDVEMPVAAAEISSAPDLDLGETATVETARRPVQGPAMPKQFWFIAGVYQ